MRNLIRFYHQLLIVCIVGLSSDFLRSQDQGLQFLAHDEIFPGRNSSIPFPQHIVIGLPDFNGFFYNPAGMESRNLWTSGNPRVNLRDLYGRMNKDSYLLQGGFGLRSFYVGKKFKRFQLGFQHYVEGFSYNEYSKDLVGLYSYGNVGLPIVDAGTVSRPLNLRSDFYASFFHAFAWETGFFLSDKISLGVGLKYLSGISHFDTDIRQAELSIGDLFYVRSKEDWQIRSASFIESLDVDSITIDTDWAFWGTHPGMAWDFSGHIATSHWDINFQIRDIGWIQWQGNEYARQGSFEFDGVEVEDFLNLDKTWVQQFQDSIQVLTAVNTQAKTFRGGIVGKLLADIQWKASDRLRIGMAAYHQLNGPSAYWRYTLAGTYKPTKRINTGLAGSLDANDRWRLGLFGSFGLGAFHLYYSVDHLPSLFHPYVVNQLGGQLGLRLGF
jgi:hypothetical protein